MWVVVVEALGLCFADDDDGDDPAPVCWDEPEAAAVVSAAVPVPVEGKEPVLMPPLEPAVVAEIGPTVRVEKREAEEVWEREEVVLPEAVVVVVVPCAAARVARRAGRRREEGTFIVGGLGWLVCSCVCGFGGWLGRGTALFGSGRGWERGKGREWSERQGGWSSFKADWKHRNEKSTRRLGDRWRVPRHGLALRWHENFLFEGARKATAGSRWTDEAVLPAAATAHGTRVHSMSVGDRKRLPGATDGSGCHHWTMGGSQRRMDCTQGQSKARWLARRRSGPVGRLLVPLDSCHPSSISNSGNGASK